MATKEEKERKEKFYDLVKKFKKLLDPQLVKVSFISQEAIILTFSNSYKVLISAWGNNTPHKIFFTEGLSLIQDLEFKNSSILLSDLSTKLEYETGMRQLRTILLAFSVDKMSKSEKTKYYNSLAEASLRVLVSEHYKLGLDPHREYFVFGNDEVRSRYEHKSLVIRKPDGIKVMVQDPSAILLDRNGDRYIDIDHGGYYKTDTHIYYDHNIWHKETCSPQESTMVTYNDETKEKTYWKMVLNDGVDLSKLINKRAYTKADKMVLKIKKVKHAPPSKHSYYEFEDSMGRIGIGHPDLLIYILE